MRQTRRDRESWIKPVGAKKKTAGGLGAAVKKPRKTATGGTKKKATTPKRPKSIDPMAALAAMPLEQRKAIMAKLGIDL